jgi:SAM-dependent methyltransferase
MVAEARQSIQPERPDIQFSIFDATSLPFPDQSFDVVVANHMLYHVPDRRQALADIRRVLRPGGRLFAATNGKGHLAELYSWVAQAASLSPSETPPLWKSVTVAFNLENGAGQLSEHFNHVESLQYPNSLAVTEAAPLMDYVRSMMGDIPTILARSDVLSRLNALWQAELDQTDVIRISISTGLFIAY